MYKEELQTKGFFIVKNVFSNSEIQEFKNIIMNYIKTNKCIINAKGITIPDFIKCSKLEKIAEIKNNKKINDILSEIFDNNYRFCSHNDIGINRIVGWHKDKLNGEHAKYETCDIWNEVDGEKHEIVKVLLYIEDHSNYNQGLKVIPGSHLERKINIKNVHQLNPAIGDIIIFDQRITHRGTDRHIPHQRILVSFGFGKNNIFTDNFEKGTVKRQNGQNKVL